MRWCTWLAAGLVPGMTAAVPGQCASTFQSPGSPGAIRVTSVFGNQQPGMTTCMTRWDPDGTGPEPEWMVVGGSFTHIDGVPAVNVAAWDGQRWRALGAGLGTANSSFESVYALAVYGGQLVAGGRFARSGNATQNLNGVARYDGTGWVPIGTGLPGTNTNTLIHALAEFNGSLYAGGAFDTPLTSRNVARWNGVQWLPVFNGLGLPGAVGGSRAPVMALHVHNGSLYAAGSFDNTPIPSIVSIARLDPATGWQPVGPLLGSNRAAAIIQDLESDGDDLLAVGRMQGLSPNLEGQIARWNGSTWTGTLTGFNTVPLNSVARVNGELLVGSDSLRLQRVNGQTLENIGPILSEPGSMISTDFRKTIVLGEHAGGALIGGNFLRSDTADIDWRYLNSLSVWDGTNFSPISNAPDRSLGTFVRYNNDLYALGSFLYVHNQRCNRVARAVGDTWVPLGDGQGLNARVHCGVEWNGKLVVGGIFTQAGGQPAHHVAAWNGTAWEALGAGVPETGVRRLFNSNGQLLAVCGDFTRITDSFTPTLRRWDGTNWVLFGDPDGSDANFGQLFVLNGELYGVRLVSEGTVRWNGADWVGVTSHAQPIVAIGAWRGTLLGVGGGTHRLTATGWERLTTGQPSMSQTLEWFEFADEFFLGGTDGIAPRLLKWNGAQWGNVSQLAISASGLVNAHVSAFAEHSGQMLVGGALNGAQQLSPSPAYLPGYAYMRFTPAVGPVFIGRTPDVLIGPGQGTALHVDVLNPAGVVYAWRRDGAAIIDGVQSDGSTITGATTDTLTIQTAPHGQNTYTVIVTMPGACSGTSAPIIVTVGCDTIDFNRDTLTPDVQDIADFLDVYAGAPCPTTACGDIDFNNDTLYPDTADIDALLQVFSGGLCQ